MQFKRMWSLNHEYNKKTDYSVFFFSPKFSEYFDRAGAVFT